MTRLRLLLVLVWLLYGVSLVFAQSEEATIYLPGTMRTCNGATAIETWVNPWGPVYLTGGYIWQGVARGLKGDVGFQLYRTPPKSTIPDVMLRVGMWDHYADPVASEGTISPLHLTPGNYVTIAPGATLQLRSSCALVGTQPSELIDGIVPAVYYATIGGVHTQAFLWYVTERPSAKLDRVIVLLEKLLAKPAWQP